MKLEKFHRMDEISFTYTYMELGSLSKLKLEKSHRMEEISFTYTYMELES